MLLKIGEVVGKILLLLFLFIIILIVPMDLIQDQDLLEIVWQNIAFVIAVLIMYALFEKKGDWALGLQQSQPIFHFFKGAGLGIVLMSLTFGLIYLFGGAKILGIDVSFMFWKSVASSLLIYIMVGIGEEILSRGYIQGLLSYRFSILVGWVVSSVIFAFLHSLNPGIWEAVFPIITLFLAGLFFAIYRDVTGGIWAPMGLHFTWNFFQGPIFGFRVSGLDNYSLIQMRPQGAQIISGGSFGAEGSLLVIIVLIGAILWYLRKFWRMKEKGTVIRDS